MSSNETPSPADGQTTYTNVAQDDSQVTVQVGVMHGDVHNLYQTKTDTPAESFRVGRNYLNGNAQQRAEGLISNAFMRGYQNPEVAYYWALAILSGRSFDHLDKQDFASLSLAFEFETDPSGGRWCRALGVVSRLMRCIAEQDSKGDADPVGFNVAMREFHALPEARREEIHRHLEMILDGSMQDQLDAQYAHDVSGQRGSADRRRRVWKFYEPDPVLPRKRRPRPVEIASHQWGLFVVGMLLSAAALALLVPIGLQRGSVLVTIMLAGLGVVVAVRLRWEQLSGHRQLEARRAARATLPEEKVGNWDERSFLFEVRKLVNAEFRYYRPVLNAPAAKRWDVDAAPVRNALCREIVDIYEDGGDLDPAKWLARWYAREFARQWRQESLPDYRSGLEPPELASLGIAAGALTAVVCLVFAFVAAFPVSWISALWAIVALIVGSVPLAAGGTAVYLEHRRYADELAGTAERFDEQLMAYRRMSEILVDRPSDSEMARWLDHDKSHVRMLAMRHYRLSYREVFAHTVLCESSGPDARRGRVVYGPPRYSVYRVLVFLLTGSGVRQFSVMVNFATGLVHDEHRFTFRYDAIASAGVIQRSVRFATARPTFGGEEARRGGPDSDHKALVFARSFRLTLVSSDWFNIQVENFDEGFMDRLHENARTLLELALDTAGITGALHILEAVAAEGKDWIARELNRRSRRFDKYQENLGLPGAPSRDAAANGGRRAPANG